MMPVLNRNCSLPRRLNSAVWCMVACLMIQGGVHALAQEQVEKNSAATPTDAAITPIRKSALKKTEKMTVAIPDTATAKDPRSEPAQTPTETNSETPPTETAESLVPTPPTPWILQPYQVRVAVSLATDPVLNGATGLAILQGLQSHLNSQFQGMWNLEVVAAEDEMYLAPEELAGLSTETVPAALLTAPDDKFFLATLSHDSGRYLVQVREWDLSSRTLGSLHTEILRDRREFVPRLAHSIAEAFRPLAELEVVSDQKIEFLVRGGEFPPRNSAMEQFQVGDYLVPYLRNLDRKREVQKIQPLPWTYLKVESVTRSRIELSITSAFGNPVAAKRKRVEIQALRIRPYLPATEIFIYPRGDKNNPLVGYRCEVMDRVPTEEDAVADRLKLETDRRGIVTVPVIEKSPLQYLYVYSGQALLAKVPFIPGYSPLLEVEVPDDRARLNVEGEVALLQSELIDIVASREVLMARTRGAAKSKKWEDVGTFLSQMQDLPTLDEFNSRIGSLQVRAVQAAKVARDRVAEIRVKKLCTGIGESAQTHLDPFRIAEFRREMDELKRNSK